MATQAQVAHYEGLAAQAKAVFSVDGECYSLADKPYKPTKPFVQIDPRWWSLGVVDGFKARPPQGGVSDQFSYFSGRVEGEAAREQGRSVDEVLAKYKIPYREAGSWCARLDRGTAVPARTRSAQPNWTTARLRQRDRPASRRSVHPSTDEGHRMIDFLADEWAAAHWSDRWLLILAWATLAGIQMGVL